MKNLQPKSRVVDSLSVPGGQVIHHPQFFFKFQSIFPQFFLISFLISVLRVGKSPTREGPGYATAKISSWGPEIWPHEYLINHIEISVIWPGS